MKAELMIQVTVGGRPLWMKKAQIPGELTARLDDKAYASVVDAAVEQLERECRAAAPEPAKASNTQTKKK